MLTQLGALFKTTFRHAEETDTRQAIRREDKKHGRKKGEEDESLFTDELWEDSAGVSVHDLRVFLMSFVAGKTHHVSGGDDAATAEHELSPEEGIDAAELPQKEQINAPDSSDNDNKDREITPASAPAANPAQSAAAAKAASAYGAYAQPENMGMGAGRSNAAARADADVDLLGGEDIRLIHMLIKDLETLEQRGIDTLTLVPAGSLLESLRLAIAALKG